MRKLYPSIFFLIFLLSASNAHATVTRDFKTPFYGGFFLGGFSPKNNPKQLTKRGEGFGFGANAGYYLNNYLSVESDLSFLFRKLDPKPDTGTPGIERRVFATVGLSVGAKASYPVWKLKPFVGGGIGVFSTDVGSGCGKSGKSICRENPGSQNSLGYHFFTGISTRVWRELIYLDFVWKRLVLNANFQKFTNGQVKLGGDWVYVSLRFGGY